MIGSVGVPWALPAPDQRSSSRPNQVCLINVHRRPKWPSVHCKAVAKTYITYYYITKWKLERGNGNRTMRLRGGAGIASVTNEVTPSGIIPHKTRSCSVKVTLIASKILGTDSRIIVM